MDVALKRIHVIFTRILHVALPVTTTTTNTTALCHRSCVSRPRCCGGSCGGHAWLVGIEEIGEVKQVEVVNAVMQQRIRCARAAVCCTRAALCRRSVHRISNVVEELLERLVVPFAAECLRRSRLLCRRSKQR